MSSSRCVNYGSLEDRHMAGLCPGGNTRYASMDLPPGKTCGDCKHFRFCTEYLGDEKDGFSGENTSCDWFPIRFIESPKMSGFEFDPIGDVPPDQEEYERWEKRQMAMLTFDEEFSDRIESVNRMAAHSPLRSVAKSAIQFAREAFEKGFDLGYEEGKEEVYKRMK